LRQIGQALTWLWRTRGLVERPSFFIGSLYRCDGLCDTGGFQPSSNRCEPSKSRLLNDTQSLKNTIQRSLAMAGKNTAAFGIYQTQGDVEYAVDALRAEGFRNTDVSVLFPENKGTKDFAVEKNTKAPEGTTTGAASGAVIGGTLGGSPELAHWPFRALDRSSLPDRSSLLSRVWALVARSAVLRGR
jgi:hypothetical protein